MNISVSKNGWMTFSRELGIHIYIHVLRIQSGVDIYNETNLLCETWELFGKFGYEQLRFDPGELMYLWVRMWNVLMWETTAFFASPPHWETPSKISCPWSWVNYEDYYIFCDRWIKRSPFGQRWLLTGRINQFVASELQAGRYKAQRGHFSPEEGD